MLMPFAVACGGEKGAAAPPAQPVQTASIAAAGAGAIFIEKGCPQCHSISAFGIKSPTDVGPDLAFASSGPNKGTNHEFIRDNGQVKWMRVAGQIARKDS